MVVEDESANCRSRRKELVGGAVAFRSGSATSPSGHCIVPTIDPCGNRRPTGCGSHGNRRRQLAMARGADRVADEVVGILLAHVEKCWRTLGEAEPYWSVVTDDRFKADRIGDNKDLFYSAGENDVRLFREAAARCKVTLPTSGTCLDLGCGVGRITRLLATSFHKVIGIDISSSHLRLAQATVDAAGLTNVEFRLVNGASSFNALPAFDCFYSMIVLQHNPPPIIEWLLGVGTGECALRCAGSARISLCRR
jgi:hypothetical protein